MAQSNTQPNTDEIPKETLKLAGALANAMKGKNEEELLNLMQNLLITVAKGSPVDEKESNGVSNVKVAGNGAVDSCETTCDPCNDSTPEKPTLPLETVDPSMSLTSCETTCEVLNDTAPEIPTLPLETVDPSTSLTSCETTCEVLNDTAPEIPTLPLETVDPSMSLTSCETTCEVLNDTAPEIPTLPLETVDPSTSLTSCETTCEVFNDTTPEIPTLPLETVDPSMSLTSCETTYEVFNDTAPEIPTLPLETNTSDTRTATGLKPVVSSESEIILPGFKGVLNGNDDSTNKETLRFEIKESEDSLKPHREPNESNSVVYFKPEIPRRTDLEEQRKGTESSADFHVENENRGKDANVPLLLDENKGSSEAALSSTLKNDDQSTTTHQFDDDEIVKNSDDDFYSLSDTVPLESTESSFKQELDVSNVQGDQALNMGSSSLIFVCDSDGGKQNNLCPDSMPTSVDVNSSNISMEKSELSLISYNKATSQQPCPLDTTKMKLSAVSDGEDMAPSTPPSGEDISESDNSSLLEISDMENEGKNHQIDYGGISPKETEILKPIGTVVEVLELNEKPQIVHEKLANQETMSSSKANEGLLQTVSATLNSGQDFKGNKPSTLPLYYLPQVAIHGSTPVLVLQPVMGSVIPSSNNKDVPYSSADTRVPFGPLIMPISPSVTTAEMSIAGLQPLQSNGCASVQNVDDTDKQTSLSQTTSSAEDKNPDLTYEEDIGNQCTGEVKEIIESNPNCTFNSLNVEVEVDRSCGTEFGKGSHTFDDLFSMDLSDCSPDTMAEGSSEFTSKNPFTEEVENKFSPMNFEPSFSPGAQSKQRVEPLGTNPFSADFPVDDYTKIFSNDSKVSHPHQIVSEGTQPVGRQRIPSDCMVTLIESTDQTTDSVEPFATVFADQSSISSKDKFIVAQETVAKDNDSVKEKTVPGITPPYWVPDEQAVTCFSCDVKFNLIRRRHHCRGCGKIFCDSCCSQLARLPYMQGRIGRICFACTSAILEANKSKKEKKKKAVAQKTKQRPTNETIRQTTADSSVSQQEVLFTATTNSTIQQLSPSSQVTGFVVPVQQYGSVPSNNAGQLMFIPSSTCEQPVLYVNPNCEQQQQQQQLAQAGLPGGISIQRPAQFIPLAKAGFPIALPTQHPPQMMLADTPTMNDVMNVHSDMKLNEHQTPSSADISQLVRHQGDNTYVVFADPVLVKHDAGNSLTETASSDSEKHNENRDQPEVQTVGSAKPFQGKICSSSGISESPRRFANNLPLCQKYVQSPPLFTSPHHLAEFKTTESKQTDKEGQQKRCSIDGGEAVNFMQHRLGEVEDVVLLKPLRPAGVVIPWKKEPTKSLPQRKTKSLERDLKELADGVNVRVADDFLVQVKKVKIEQSPRASISLWCFCSEGLSAHGQKEVVLMLEKLPKEAVFPQQIMQVYRAIYLLAKSGTYVEHGSYLSTHGEFFLDFENSAGLIFASSKLQGPTCPIDLKSVKQPFLYCLIYMKSERHYAMYTPTRLLLCLGQKMKQFPFPLWNPRKREPVYFGVDRNDKFYSTTYSMNKYLKNSYPEAFIPGLHIIKTESKIVLRIPAEAHSEVLHLFDRLIVKENQSGAVPMLADISSVVDSYVVFNQIKETQVSYRKTTSMFCNPRYEIEKPTVIGLVFIMLHLRMDSSSRLTYGGDLLDDGVLMFLSRVHTIKLNKALRERVDCYIHLGDGCKIAHFELRWSENNLPSQFRKSSRAASLENTSVTSCTTASSETVSSANPQSPATGSHYLPQSMTTGSRGTIQNTITGSSVTPQNSVKGSRKTSQDSNTRQVQELVYPGTATVDIFHAGYASEIRELRDRVAGDPNIILREMVLEMRSACTDSLMLYARKMKPKERKELQLRLTATPGYKKWAIGPPDQAVALIRSMQMALNPVSTPEVTNKDIALSFFVVIEKH